MKTVKTNLTALILFVLIASGSFLTCDVGLGDSVDTKPPTISISYPPPVSIIRGAFVVAGSAMDETALNSVLVTMHARSGSAAGTTFGPWSASISPGNNSWSVTVPQMAADGDYDVTAEAIDSANRRTSASISYKIDNTPPVLVVQRPSTKGYSNPFEIGSLDPFGSTINFNGNYWDLNGAGEIRVFFYTQNGTLVNTDPFSYVPPTQNWDFKVEGPVYELLKSNVATNGNTIQPYWYVIQFTDNAFPYTTPAEGSNTAGKTGNSITHYYKYVDISRLLQSGETYPKLTALSAFDATSVTNGLPASLIAGLSSIRISSNVSDFINTKNGNFSFDPLNKNPTITITELPISAPLPSPSDNTTSPQPSLNIKIEPNKDGDFIDEQSVVVVLTPFDDAGTLQTASAETYTYATLPRTPVFQNNALFINFIVNKANGRFQVSVTARDKAIPYHEVTTKFGFSINTGAPSLVSVSPDKSPASTKINSNAGKIAVVVKGSDGEEDVSLSVLEENLSVPSDAVITLSSKVKTGNTWNFEWLVTLNAGAEGSTRSLRFALEDAQYSSTPRTITFEIDNTPPVLQSVELPAVKPTGHVAQGKAVVTDSLVSVKGYATADLEKAILKFTSTNTPPLADTVGWTEALRDNSLTSGFRGFSGSIPLVAAPAVAAEGTYYLWARFADDTYDSVLQNYGPVTALLTVVFDKGYPAITETAVNTASRVYRTGAFNLSGEATDGNAINSLVVSTSFNSTPQSDVNPAIGGGGVWTHALGSPSNGLYRFILTLTDIAGNVTTLAREVYVDSVAPVLAITGGASNINVNTAEHTFRGAVVETGSGIHSVEVSMDNGASWLAAEGTTTWFYTHNFGSIDEGPTRVIQVRASDFAGNSSGVVSANYTIDLADPRATIDAPIISQSNAASVVFSGTADDAAVTAGRAVVSASLSFRKNGGSAQSVTAGPGVNQFNLNATTGMWDWTLDSVALGDGQYEVTLQVVDAAGKTASATHSIFIDQTAPTLIITHPATAQAVGDDTYIIRGTATDGLGVGFDGTDDVQYSFDSNNGSDGTWTSFVGSEWGGYNWNKGSVIPSSPEGAKKLYVRATDSLGNISSTFVDFQFDLAPPTLTASTPPANTNIGFDITGTADDSNNLATITVTQTKNGVGTVAISIGAPTPDPIVDHPNRVTWSLTGLPRDPGSPADTLLNDGVYEYIITATDIAGRTTQETRTVRFDATAPESIVINAPAVNEPVGSSYTISGTASDAGSGLSQVFYSFDTTSWSPAGGTTNWFATAEISGTEGPQTLYIQAQDNATNRNSVSTERAFIFDTAAPLLTIDGDASRELNSIFSVTGTATDNYGIASYAITQQKGTGAEVVVSGSNFTTGGTVQNATWALSNLPRDPATPADTLFEDGVYVYRVTTTDLAGKTSVVKTVSVTIDRTAPVTNDVIAPSVGQTGVNALSGTSYLFRGNAVDGVGGVGVAKIWYVINSSATAPAAGYTEILTSDTWSFSKLLPSQLAEGTGYYLHVLAEDRSGNRTDTTAATSVLFDVDLANPVLTETTVNTVSVVNRKAAFTLDGEATDSHGIASITVTQKRGSGSAVLIDSTPPTLGGTVTSRTWTLTGLPRDPASIGATLLTDELYEYVITATDLAGKHHTLTRLVRFDTTGPTTSITSPAANSWLNTTSVTINGVSSDLSGVEDVYYAIGGTEPSVSFDLSVPANWAGAGWTLASGTNSWDIPLTGLSEGSRTIWIRAIDVSYNISTPLSRVFGVDTAVPLLSASNPSANTNVGFSITGTASDTNALAATAITVTQKKGTDTPVSISINGPTTADSWANWTLPNLPRDPASIGVQDGLDSSSDGVYEYIITATDIAGRTTQVTRTVRFDATAPETVAITTPAVNEVIGSSYTISGTAADAGSSVAQVYYSFDNTSWSLAGGTSNWNATATLTGAEGPRTLYIQAQDNATNRNSVSTTRTFRFDTAAPLVTIDGTASRELNSIFSVTGTATDNYGIDTYLIYQKKDAGVDVLVSGSGFLTGGTAQSATWTLSNLPRDPATPADTLLTDGVYVYRVTTVDLANKSSVVKTVTVTIDQTAPATNLITAPSVGQTGVNSVSGSSYLFRGSAADGAGGVGVAKIWYEITTSATATVIGSTPTAAGYTEILTSGTWSFSKLLPSQLAEGTGYYLHVLAEDRSGNRTDTTAAASVAFDVDLNNPSLTETTIGSPTTTFVRVNQLFSGTVSDTNGLTAFSVSINGDTPISITPSGGTWSYTLDVSSLSDGTYTLAFTATDAVGKKTEVARTVQLDKTAPVIVITAPESLSASSTQTVTISGTSRDTGGVGFTSSSNVDVEYSLNSTNGVDGTWVTLNSLDATHLWSATGVDLGASEGPKKLYIRSTDRLGNVGTSFVDFYYDQNPPTFTETSIATTDTQYRNVNTIFSGVISDTNTSVAPTVSVRINGAPSIPITPSGTSWSYTADAGALGNGSYTLVFTGTDAANKTVNITRTLVIDTSIPGLDSITNIATQWFTAGTRTLSGTASDTGGSGLESIRYRISSDNGSTWSSWSNFTGTSSFTGSASFADGITNRLEVQAVDRAGNLSASNLQTVWIDTIAPDFDITSPVAIPISNGTGTLDITVSATDATSGAALVEAKVGSTDFTTGTIYNAAIALETGTVTIGDLSALTEGNRRIYLRVTDTAGNRTPLVSQSIIIDKTSPTAAFTSHANSATVNKTISFAGTASDTNGIASVVLQVYKNTGTWGWITAESGTTTGDTNWIHNGFDTSAISAASASYDSDVAAGLQLRVRALVTDSAGNTTTSERTLVVDQDSDRPVVRLSNVKTDGTTTLINTTTVSGTLLDDDGTVDLANFAISEDGSTWIVATANPVIANPGNPLFYDLDTRSFQYAPSALDGQKHLYVRITDVSGTTFTTPLVYDAGAILGYPKMQFSTDTGTATGNRVSFKIDTNPPDIHSDIFFDVTDPWSFDGATAFDPEYRLLNNTIFGGARSEVALRVSARDTAGIQSVSLSIDGTPYTMSKVSGDVGDWEVFTTPPLAPIDVSSWPSGTRTVSIVVTDNSLQNSSSSRQIVIDNDSPTIDVTSHTMNQQVTGDLILRGTANDDSGSGIDIVEYRVGTDIAWTAVSGTFSWSIDFTQAATNVITTTATYANSTHAVEQSAGIWRLPITIRATDKIGNTEQFIQYLDIDPDGDKPIVTVIYPSDISTLGGTIRIFGSAQDNVSVLKVWMMIDVDNDGNYDIDDRDALMGMGYTIVGTGTIEDPYQFEVNGTASWSQSINGSGEFNPADGDPAKPLNFRVRAQDNNGTYGNWSDPRTIYFDNNAPQIGSDSPLKLVQYTDETYTTIAVEKDYIANMFIRGEWFLIGSVWDESGINAINLTGSSSGTLGSHENTWFIRDGAVNGTTGKYNYQLRIPVGRALTDLTAGKLTYSLYVEDASDPTGTATQSILLNYDNKAPVAAAPTHGGLPINTTNLVVQSNRLFTFTSEVTESDPSDSGFDRLVFFFVRRGTVERVYNPMLAKAHPNNRTNLSALTWTPGDIPRLVLSGATRNGEDTVTHVSIENNANIRNGGLVRIAGVDRMISDVNYTTGTVTFSPAAAISYTDAQFAYGLVVNNTTRETGIWDGDTLLSIEYDDGDGMIESVTRSGGSYIWDATIDSKNIPDGPIELHYVAFDKAGNSVAGAVSSSVSNNRPRLAKVLVGTDLSGDNLFSSTELTTYYTAVSGAESSLVNLSSSAFRVKGRLAIIPEFVGGNGTLQYIWTTNGIATDVWDGVTLPETAITGAVTPFTTITETDTSLVHLQAIIIETTEIETMDDVLKLFSVGFWDETEETTQGTNSQWARLNAPLIVDVVDNISPKAVISPFYWTSSSANSLYGNARANGHIELEADLPTATFNQPTGVYDLDPKVSGKISIRGTAYDDQRLDEIWMFIGNGNTSEFTFTNATTTSNEFDTNADGTPEVLGRTYTRLAAFNASTGVWDVVVADVNAVEGWTFTVTPDYFNQSGHKVNWQLDWDSSKITGVAATDRQVRVIATDRRPNASSETANETADITTNNRPVYQIDVVPYITEIETRLSTAYSLNKSVMSRSANGRYPIWRKQLTNTPTWEIEQLRVKGFNLNPSASNVFTVSAVEDGLNAGKDGLDAGATQIDHANVTTVIASSEYLVTPISVVGSGYFNALVINGTDYIPTLNNTNDNEAKGDYAESLATNMYNREPNGMNNDILDDDRYLSLWELTKVTNTGDIRNLDMEIFDNTLNFSAGHVDDRYSVFQNITNMSAAPSNLRRSYTRYFDNKMSYNTTGTVFTVSQCADTQLVPVTNWGRPSHFAISRGLDMSLWEYNSSQNTGVLFVEANWNGSDLNKLDRVQLPDLKMAGDDTLSLGYLSYYDSAQKLIKFRYFEAGTAGFTPGLTTNGNLGGGVSSTLLPYVSANNNIGTYTADDMEQAVSIYTSGSTWNQGFVALAGADGNSPYSATGFLSDGTALVAWYDAIDGSLKLASNPNPATSFSAYQAFTTRANATPVAGTYTFKLSLNGALVNSGNDISVTLATSANGTQKHELAYQLNKVLSEQYNVFAEVDPVTSRVTVRSFQTGATQSIALSAPTAGTSLLTTMGGTQAAIPGIGSEWTYQPVDSQQAGKYVALTVDTNDGIHLAYQETANGDLKYAYLASLITAPVTVVVDSYQQVGQFIDITTLVIDINGDGDTEIVPYISYYNMSYADTRYSAKMAYLNLDAINSVADVTSVTFNATHSGAVSEKFTGNWEILTIPAQEVPKQFRVNIGVKTNGDLFVGYQGDFIEYARHRP